MNKLLIGPNSQLGIDDFARLYLGGEGATPRDADRNININYPTEAKSVLDRSWRNLNINQSPEQYFASVANPAAAGQPIQPQVVAPAATGQAWPVFKNEIDRNIAIDSGQVDYRYNSPLQKQRAQALEAIQAQKAMDFRRAQVAQAPTIDQLGDPEKHLQYQLAGDDGTAKKVLFSLNRTGDQIEGPALSYADYLGTPENQRSSKFKPYVPTASFGKLNNTDVPTRLDSNIYYDPEFQKTLQQTPDKAKFIYSRLTGRELDSDINEHVSLRKQQLDVARGYATEQLKSGATRDPRTGDWTVLNTADAPEGGVSASLNGQQRPYRQFVKATPQQKAWLDSATPAITNRPLEQFDHRGDGEVGMRLQQMQNDPDFQQHKQVRETQLRRTLNNDETLHLVDEIKSKRLSDAADPSKLPWYQKVAATNDAFWSTVVGVNPEDNSQKAEWLKYLTSPAAPAPANPVMTGAPYITPRSTPAFGITDPQVRKILGL